MDETCSSLQLKTKKMVNVSLTWFYWLSHKPESSGLKMSRLYKFWFTVYTKHKTRMMKCLCVCFYYDHWGKWSQKFIFLSPLSASHMCLYLLRFVVTYNQKKMLQQSLWAAWRNKALSNQFFHIVILPSFDQTHAHPSLVYLVSLLGSMDHSFHHTLLLEIRALTDRYPSLLGGCGKDIYRMSNSFSAIARLLGRRLEDNTAMDCRSETSWGVEGTSLHWPLMFESRADQSTWSVMFTLWGLLKRLKVSCCEWFQHYWDHLNVDSWSKLRVKSKNCVIYFYFTVWILYRLSLYLRSGSTRRKLEGARDREEPGALLVRGRGEERQQRGHVDVLCQQASELFNEVRKACGTRKNLEGKERDERNN